MGKTVKTVLKIAAVVAIAYFAPQLAPVLLKAAGTATATGLATTVTSAAIGAAAGEATGVGWKAGAFAAGGSAALGGAGGAASTTGAGAGTAGTAGATTLSSLTPGVQAGITSPLTAGGAFGSSAGLSTAAGTTAAGVGAGTAAGTTAAAAVPATLGAKLGAVATQVGNAGLAGLKATAPQLGAALLAGNPGGALAKAQQEEFFRAQQANASLTQARLSEANKLRAEADYFNPEYMGRQAAEAAMIKGGIQATEGTRGLTGERLAAERRRYNLGTARTAGTAYQQGALTGAEARYKARTTALAAMPTSYPMTDSTGALNARTAAYDEKAATEKGLSELFGRVLKPTT